MKRQSGTVATLDELVMPSLCENGSESRKDVLARVKLALTQLVSAGQSYWEISGAAGLFASVDAQAVHTLAQEAGIKLIGRLPYRAYNNCEEATACAKAFAEPFDAVILEDFCRYDPGFKEEAPVAPGDKKRRKRAVPVTSAPLTEETKVLMEMNAAVVKAIRLALQDKELFAEDTAGSSPFINRLLSENGLNGCRVLEKGFFGRNPANRHLPHNWSQGCVAYLSVPKGEGIEHFLYHGDPLDVGFAVDYLNLSEREGYAFGFIRGLMASPAGLTLIGVKDILPGGEALTPALLQRLKYYTRLFGRC